MNPVPKDWRHVLEILALNINFFLGSKVQCFRSFLPASSLLPLQSSRVHPILEVLVGFIRFQFIAHGGQLYERISLESSLNLII